MIGMMKMIGVYVEENMIATMMMMLKMTIGMMMTINADDGENTTMTMMMTGRMTVADVTDNFNRMKIEI